MTTRELEDDMTAHLIGRTGGTGLVLVEQPGALPAIAWCGVVRDGLSAEAVETLAVRGVDLQPENGRTGFGRPALSGHRGRSAAAAWSSLFDEAVVNADPHGAQVSAVDRAAGLTTSTDIEAVAGGLLRLRHTVTNTATTAYHLEHLEVVVPVPDSSVEALDFSGRWTRERVPQRHPVRDGLWLREGRRGKTGFDNATVLAVGEPGFDFAHGELLAVHVAWSGNTTYRLERIPELKAMSAVTTIGGGELLLPGEVILESGESYRTPWVYVGAADGLDELAARFHAFLRDQPTHPTSPRPVTLNVWEAVFMDHDLDTLRDLAQVAADVGVERFVLDDGWFGGRRDDRAGLGDWVVAADVWPEGLDPLIARVHGLGMQFGLWIEPEMINADSDLYRAHPDWILSTGGRVPPEERFQQVLDLTQPAAFDHVWSQLTAVFDAHPVDYVKWDHNRDLIDAGSNRISGRPAVHDNTLAYYRLLDRLRARYPDIEWETCASGGARIDLEVLVRAERVWVSDQNDALSRQHIQRWTTQLVPPEYLGAHVSGPVSHQTHRRLPLDFRVGTAMFGHLGIEWNLLETESDERKQLASWIDLHKTHRALLHSGRVFRRDLGVEGVWTHGVVAADRSEAVVAYVQLDELLHQPPRLRIPGLDPLQRYRVRRIDPSTWPEFESPTSAVSGAVLGEVGLVGPSPAPLSALLVHVSVETSPRSGGPLC